MKCNIPQLLRKSYLCFQIRLKSCVLTNLGIIIKQQVVGALVAGTVVGSCAAVPLHHHSLIWCRCAALPPDLHHGAHVAFAVILVTPFPVQAADHAHAHLHAASDGARPGG